MGDDHEFAGYRKWEEYLSASGMEEAWGASQYHWVLT